MQSKNQQEFFKVLPSSSFIPNKHKPTLANYNSILQTLQNHNFLYLDFNKNDHDCLALLQKTNSPLKNHSQDQEDDDINDNGTHDFEALGNQFILDMNNLSLHSYKMMRYVSEGKKIMKKKRNVDEIQTSFINDIKLKGAEENNKINFGPKYRRIQQRSKRLQYSSKIQPQKLEEYLESKNYRKVERRLERSEKQLEKYVTNVRELREKSVSMSGILGKANCTLLIKDSKMFGQKKKLENRGIESLRKCSSQKLEKVIQRKIVRFPQIKRLSRVLGQCFTQR